MSAIVAPPASASIWGPAPQQQYSQQPLPRSLSWSTPSPWAPRRAPAAQPFPSLFTTDPSSSFLKPHPEPPVYRGLALPSPAQLFRTPAPAPAPVKKRTSMAAIAAQALFQKYVSENPGAGMLTYHRVKDAIVAEVGEEQWGMIKGTVSDLLQAHHQKLSEQRPPTPPRPQRNLSMPSMRRQSSLKALSEQAEAMGVEGRRASTRRFCFGPGPSTGSSGHRVRTHTATIQVPIASVGSIMGPNGSVVKRLRAESGALIVLQQKDQMVPGQRRRAVNLSGTEEEVKKAREMIAEIIGADATRGRIGSVGSSPVLSDEDELSTSPTADFFLPPRSKSTPVLLQRSSSRRRLSLKPRSGVHSGQNASEAGVRMAKGPNGTAGFTMQRTSMASAGA